MNWLDPDEVPEVTYLSPEDGERQWKLAVRLSLSNGASGAASKAIDPQPASNRLEFDVS